MNWIEKVLAESESLALDSARDRAVLAERLAEALPLGELVGIIRETLRAQARHGADLHVRECIERVTYYHPLAGDASGRTTECARVAVDDVARNVAQAIALALTVGK